MRVANGQLRAGGNPLFGTQNLRPIPIKRFLSTRLRAKFRTRKVMDGVHGGRLFADTATPVYTLNAVHFSTGWYAASRGEVFLKILELRMLFLVFTGERIGCSARDPQEDAHQTPSACCRHAPLRDSVRRARSEAVAQEIFRAADSQWSPASKSLSLARGGARRSSGEIIDRKTPRRAALCSETAAPSTEFGVTALGSGRGQCERFQP
jgi:hypothetical protein